MAAVTTSSTAGALVEGVEMDTVEVKILRAQPPEIRRQSVAGPDAHGVHVHLLHNGLSRAAAEEVASAPAAARRPLRLQQPLDVQKDAAGSELRRYAPQGVGQASEGGQGVGRQLVPGDTCQYYQCRLGGTKYPHAPQDPFCAFHDLFGYIRRVVDDGVGCRPAAEAVAAERHHHAVWGGVGG